VRQNLLGSWADDPARVRQMRQLCEQILGWWLPTQAGDTKHNRSTRLR
jgi:hypothetical protein